MPIEKKTVIILAKFTTYGEIIFRVNERSIEPSEVDQDGSSSCLVYFISNKAEFCQNLKKHCLGFKTQYNAQIATYYQNIQIILLNPLTLSHMAQLEALNPWHVGCLAQQNRPY